MLVSVGPRVTSRKLGLLSGRSANETPDRSVGPSRDEAALAGDPEAARCEGRPTASSIPSGPTSCASTARASSAARRSWRRWTGRGRRGRGSSRCMPRAGRARRGSSSSGCGGCAMPAGAGRGGCSCIPFIARGATSGAMRRRSCSSSRPSPTSAIAASRSSRPMRRAARWPGCSSSTTACWSSTGSSRCSIPPSTPSGAG